MPIESAWLTDRQLFFLKEGDLEPNRIILGYCNLTDPQVELLHEMEQLSRRWYRHVRMGFDACAVDRYCLEQLQDPVRYLVGFIRLGGSPALGPSAMKSWPINYYYRAEAVVDASRTLCTFSVVADRHRVCVLEWPRSQSLRDHLRRPPVTR